MDPQEFDRILSYYECIKKKRVDEQLKFYTDNVKSKRLFAQWSGVVVLFISLAIPVVTVFLNVQQKNLIITVMSLLISLLSGLEALHQWRTTWREYSRAIVAIKTLVGLWEVKIANARRLSNPDGVSKELGSATEELLGKVEEVTSAEMSTFFSLRSMAERASGKEGQLQARAP